MGIDNFFDNFVHLDNNSYKYADYTDDRYKRKKGGGFIFISGYSRGFGNVNEKKL